ncbi:hypothetical protein Tco_0544237 [Tanacetum coccineum]
MHTRASNSKLVEPLPEPKHTLNRRLRRRNRRVPFDLRNNPPQHPRIVYLPILNINYFCHFLDILQNYDSMNDEPMWAADRVVALTLGSAITILETANEFAIKGSSNTNTNKIMAQIDAMTIKMDDQYKELQSRAKQPTPELDDDDIPMSREEEAKFMQTFCKTRFYNDYRDRDSNHDNWRSSGRNDYNRHNYRSNTDYKPYDLQRQFNDSMKSRQSTNAFVKETFMDLKTQLKTVAKNHQALIQNLETKFDKLADKQSGRPSGSLPSNTQPNPKGSSSKPYQPPDDEEEEPTPQPKLKDPKPVKEIPIPKPYKPKIPYSQRLRKEKMEAQYGKFLDMIQVVRINKQINLGVGTERMIFNIDSAMKHSYSNDDTCFSIDEILEEDFDALLDEGSKILHSISD